MRHFYRSKLVILESRVILLIVEAESDVYSFFKMRIIYKGNIFFI